MGVAASLDTAREELRLDRAAEAARRRRFLAGYLLVSASTSLLFALFYTRHGGFPWSVTVVTLALAAAQLGAFLGAVRGHAYGAGVLAQVLPIAPVLFVASALSVEAGFGSILFIGALGVMVTVPDDHHRTRFVVVGVLITSIVVTQAVFTRSRAWAPLDHGTTTQLNTANRLIMTIALFALALELTRATRAANKLVEASLRVAELLATTDPLTGLPNRRQVWDRLEIAEQPQRVIALADVDHFKTLNDTYGHDCGDEALQHVADVLADAVRDTDLVARWGGEEFVLVIEATPTEAVEVLERARLAVESSAASCGLGDHAVTVSIGWAAVDGDPAVALRKADEALYRAKESGRNLVVSN